MKKNHQTEILISGLGVTSSIGQGKADFSSALIQGQHVFNIMKREGRQCPILASTNKPGSDDATAFIGGEIPSLRLPCSISSGLLRTASFSGQVALTTLHEAWHDANLNDVDPTRIGLIIGGSNFQQRELSLAHIAYQDRLHFLRPTYALNYMDSDLCGLCTESFNIQGFAYTIGAASASGQVAVIQAVEAVQSGKADVCIAMGALMDLSYWECQGFRNIGAMGTDHFADQPALASRPFDQRHDGFIYGESCGVVVVERAKSINRSAVKPYARISSCAMGMDGNRNPNPSMDGEVNVIQKAISQAGFKANEIDYINPHGTGSIIGDETELQAIKRCELNGAYINTTKSIIGHGLSAAGTVEIIATLLQMEAGYLHPSRNLDNPIDLNYNWVRNKCIAHDIEKAINLSMGFGGINSAVCLQKI